MQDKNILALVGNRIREIRKAKGLSQEALAERSGYQTSYIGGVERGERNISLVNLAKIADSLAIHVGELFNFDVDVLEIGHSLALNEIILMLNQRKDGELQALTTILKELFKTYESKPDS